MELPSEFSNISLLKQEGQNGCIFMYMQHFPRSANQPVCSCLPSDFCLLFYASELCRYIIVQNGFINFGEQRKLRKIMSQSRTLVDITFFNLGEHCWFSDEIFISHGISESYFLYLSLALSPDYEILHTWLTWCYKFPLGDHKSHETAKPLVLCTACAKNYRRWKMFIFSEIIVYHMNNNDDDMQNSNQLTSW